MKTIKFIVEVESKEDNIRRDIERLYDTIDKDYIYTRVYEYQEPVEELKPNRP